MPLSDGPRVAPGYMVDSGVYGSAVQDALETVKDLQWPSTIDTYSKMRRDPQIAATLNAYMLPIRAGHWFVDPAGCRPEVVEVVADAWGLPVLGVEAPPSGFRKRGVLWKEHLRMALLELVYGHMPFAFAGEITGNPRRWRITEIPERMPQTIADIVVNDNGSLDGILQYGADDLIPARNLLWYVHDREGANWAGTSMLREAYGPWLLKHDMWRVLGISSRRFGTGVPNVTAPPGATDAEVERAARLAESARVGDQAGAGMPDGFKFNLTGLTGTVPDTLGFVKYLDSQIAQAVLASVLNLPNSDTGNRALGETLISLLRLSWEAVADEIAIPASRLSALITDVNFGPDEASPTIICQGLGRPEATADAISALIQVGAITPDPGIERWAREMYQLPEIDPEFVKKPAPVPPPPPPPGTPVGPEVDPGREKVAAGRRSRLAFNPNQKRDPDGKWGDGVPNVGSTALEVASDLLNGNEASVKRNDLPDLMKALASAPSTNLSRLEVDGERNLFRKHAREIPRADMPQLPTKVDRLGEFTDALAERNITGELEEVDPRTLTATQNELDSAKVGQMYARATAGTLNREAVAFVSRDGIILDGHHRWAALAAAQATGTEATMKVIRLDTDIDTLLEVANTVSGPRKTIGAVA